jgi:hypothetical protein
MPWIMQILGEADDIMEQYAPIYLKTFDLEANGGHGAMQCTKDKSEAFKWDSMIDLMMAWKAPSESRPLRPDGKPNRPLTAFSISPIEYKGEG